MEALKRTMIVTVLASTALLAGCQSGDSGGAAAASPGNAEHGKMVFATTCATCHGVDGTGVKGLGKDLVHSEWIKQTPDADVVKMVLTGRSASDPLNTTKIAMPAKGGNASLSDQDIADAVAYMKSINKPN
jgi:mono/diheme cytochrome c family protein